MLIKSWRTARRALNYAARDLTLGARFPASDDLGLHNVVLANASKGNRGSLQGAKKQTCEEVTKYGEERKLFPSRRPSNNIGAAESILWAVRRY